jgi:protein SCO1/2
MNFRHLIAASVIALIAHGGATGAQETVPNRDATRANAKSGASLYNLGSQWTTQDGASVRLGSFAGRPVIAAMGSTICTNDYPAIVADMIWVEKHLTPDEADLVRFAFFSFDWEADTPERLRLYAESHNLDLNRWTLLRGDDGAVRELATALDVRFRRDDLRGFDHAAVISLIDEKGEIVIQLRGPQSSSEAFLHKIRALLSGAN